MSHHCAIFEMYPKLSDNNKFVLESFVLLFIDTFNQFGGIDNLTRGNCGKFTFDYISMNKTTLDVVVWEKKFLKLTISKCPRSEGRTSISFHWLLNILYASICCSYWEPGLKLLVWRQKFRSKRRFWPNIRFPKDYSCCDHNNWSQCTMSP